MLDDEAVMVPPGLGQKGVIRARGPRGAVTFPQGGPVRRRGAALRHGPCLACGPQLGGSEGSRLALGPSRREPAGGEGGSAGDPRWL